MEVKTDDTMAITLKAADREWAEEVLEKITKKLKAECSRMGDMIPYIARNGRYHDIDTGEGIYWWTNGFWPGLLWQMYHAAGEKIFRETAEAVEKRLDAALEGFEGLHHDVGFMWLHSSVANYRLTGNTDSRRRGLHAANLLAGRYNPAGKFIRAWNMDRTGWIIIDCMMNIPLLYWASAETGDPRYTAVALGHADTAMNVLVRPDGSCNHIAVLAPETGECLELPGGQGYASGSSWSRGQSWGLYGFALSYRHTALEKYLNTAKRVAHYVIANFAHQDWLPVVDFRSPVEPVKHDSTAAMISACGLLETALHVTAEEQALYTQSAVKILRACEQAFADWDTERDGIIGKATGCYHGGPADTEVPMVYADYFFAEAIARLVGKDFLIW